MMTTRFNKTIIALALLNAYGLQQANAQEASSIDKEKTPTLEVIEVTAQKRVQSLQDVPASITTMDGNMLADTGITQM